MKAMALLLASFLAAAAHADGAADAKAAPATRAATPPPEFGVPGTVPVGPLWADFLARADEEPVFAEMRVVDELYPDADGADADKCRARRDELDRASRRVPVSIGVWYVRQSCALALGDAKRADESEQALAALTRFDFAGMAPDHGRSAIRIVSLDDAYALAMASGDTMVYHYFDLEDHANGLPLVLGMRDEKTGRDRELRFDFVSSVIALRREPDDDHYPDERGSVARATIKAMAKDDPENSPGQAQALIELMQQPRTARMQQMLKLARGGSYPAALASAWCILDKKLSCAQEEIDALLPFAEKGLARPMLLLAHAYATGRGVKQDADAARKLVKGAARRVGDGEAFSLFVAMTDEADDATAIDDWAMEGLAKAADAGDPQAAMTAAAASVSRRPVKDAALTPRELAWLEMAERRGLHTAVPILVADARLHKDAARASAYMLKWADRDASVAASLAAAYEDGKLAGIPRDARLALQWYTRAGMLGDVPSMRRIGAHYMSMNTPGNDSKGVRWLYGAAYTGDFDATLDLALALTTTASLGPDSLKSGVAIYRAVLADKDSPRARRAFARLLMDGHGVDRDIAQAKALLLKDADKGDAESQLALARAMSDHKLGRTDPQEMWGWVRKAEAAGSRGAALWLADAMFNGAEGLPVDRRQALDRLDKLVAAGSVSAANNYAWYLCTGPDAALRDPARGLAVIEKILGPEPQSTHLDTKASCLAAHSDFAAAVDFQQRAIAALAPGNAKTLEGMQSRLALYKSGKAMVLDAGRVDTATATPAAGGK